MLQLFLFQCLQKKTFDQTYGLYHILLDKLLKVQRNTALNQQDGINQLADLTITSRSESPLCDVETNKSVSFEPSSPGAPDEKCEPTSEELAKYHGKRRQTIEVSHITPDFNPRFNDGYNIPEISIFRPATPPLHELTNQLQYKEQYLPRPAVLQVRPQFDRRASDGSATLQESIARFNMQNTVSNNSNNQHTAGQEENGNVLGIPEAENGGSESDNEPDPEAVQRYLKTRGSKQRHTFNCILEATPEEQDSVLSNFRAQQSSKARNSIKLANRDQRASPVPYLPLSPAPYLPVSPESRRSITGDRRPSADSGLGVHHYQDKRKQQQEEDLTIKQLQFEHKKLRDQFSPNPGGTPSDHGARTSRRGSQNMNLFRHSYPVYPEQGTPPNDAPIIPPPLIDQETDPNVLMLLQKQEAQRKNLYVQLIVQKKFLEKQQQAERQELIRRASEGAPKLESSVAEFLKNHKEKKNCGNATPTEEGLPPVANDLQDEMKKLNLQVNSGLMSDPSFADPLFEERQRSNTNPNEIPSFASTLPPFPTMDIDDETTSGGDVASSPPYRYANVQSLFNNPTIGASRSRGNRRGNPFPISPRFSLPGLSFQPFINDQEIGSPTAQQTPTNNNSGGGGGLLWTPGGNGTESGDNTPECLNSPSSGGGGGNAENNENNAHENLNRTLSVDMTSSLTLTQVVDAVKRCLDERPDVDYSQSDSFFSLYKEGIQLEIEVYPLTKQLGKNAVKVRRVGGDKWAYKKLRDDLLSGLYL